MVTTTLRLPWVTRSLVPNGRRPRGLLYRSVMTPVMMVMVMMMPMMMVTRTGRCLGHAPRKENSCSDHGDRHTRPG